MCCLLHQATIYGFLLDSGCAVHGVDDDFDASTDKQNYMFHIYNTYRQCPCESKKIPVYPTRPAVER